MVNSVHVDYLPLWATMAHTPSPPGPLPGANIGMHPDHRSLSPPAQPMSKKDKKRAQYHAHQQDLVTEFAQNRDVHYRSQLVALQYDMNFITQADPYNPEPLEDSPDAIAKMIAEAAAGTPYQADMSKLAGRWYSEFVQEVNDAKEAKEIQLTQLVVCSCLSRYSIDGDIAGAGIDHAKRISLERS